MTKRYILLRDPLFMQGKEEWEDEESSAYILHDHDDVIIGPSIKISIYIKRLDWGIGEGLKFLLNQ